MTAHIHIGVRKHCKYPVNWFINEWIYHTPVYTYMERYISSWMKIGSDTIILYYMCNNQWHTVYNNFNYVN